MSDVLVYNYSISEEIARWSFEVFLDHKSSGKWWIAFTNPTAGPWKKITSKNEAGKLIEVYRFSREEDRPDIVAVSDEMKQIIIFEAKDYAHRLVGEVQMKKSAQVIVDMEKVLKAVNVDAWNIRKSYDIIPGFLWFSESNEKSIAETKLVTQTFLEIRDQLDQSSETSKEMPVNVVIRETEDGLTPFIFKGFEPIDIKLFKA